MNARLWLGLGMALTMAVSSGCVAKIGNTQKTCREGEPCLCEGMGNCLVECPEGGCGVRCEGTGNCYLSCEPGDCHLSCEGTGNCIIEECSGGCEIECIGFGNCICSSGCDTTADPPLVDAG
jgi:hypothetical protein